MPRMISALSARATSVLVLFLFVGLAFGYQPQKTNNAQLNRRNFFAFVGASAAANVLIPDQPANAVISAKYCAYGSGEGCDDLAEGNEFIRQLQEKSAANKEKNESDALYAFYMKNYPDVFAVSGKTMIKKADGTFLLVSGEELMALKKDNKIGIENVKAMGGKVADLTQKPVLVLKE
mmetsp:Transcript_5589/g.13154  ORF Transcript_5589/g.13154 Transcript_5589/m.13154 type:complete len:178 (+) Transcript_5589:44-577(+)|eukprot:CAMPEP_0113625046 /NCGR_PEP_ID=MMETSP0017_2-20120614/12927_1 /TAXON_ID=2856 /ORGANISM="Cylindrotheca closterium" /LENGTH=177 /DNA_ID=CAMNT_0000535127 /DNA_START=44 /DNA_END=577 /DNA_ORIENTATION=- /assembly_acc=CAM_ASM_000147